MFVNGMSVCMRVISPPPSPVCLSCLRVVYPGNFGVLSFCFSLVSWISAMCMLCVCKKCFSCCCLFLMPSMLYCIMLSVFCFLLRRGGALFCVCRGVGEFSGVAGECGECWDVVDGV